MEDNNQKTKILLVGTGAVGSYFGGKLAQTDVQISALCRSDYDIVNKSGIEIKSYKGDFHFAPEEIIQNASDCSFDPDYILVSLKVLPQVDIPAIIKPAVGPETVIVLIQNGIEIETGVAEAFPENEIISAIAFIAVKRLELGVISHQGSGMITLGNFPTGITEKTGYLAELFSKVDVPCKTTENIYKARWGKMIWNVSFNPISVLGGGADSKQMVSLEKSENLVRKVMEEVAAIAKATGNELPEDAIAKAIASNKKMHPFKTSMLVDYEAGRALEIDAILGNSIKVGKRVGISTPYMESLYGLLKLHEITSLK